MSSLPRGNTSVTVSAPLDVRRLLRLIAETANNPGEITIYGEGLVIPVAAGATVQHVFPTYGEVLTILDNVSFESDTYDFTGNLTVQAFLDGKALVGPFATSSAPVISPFQVSLGQYLFGFDELMLQVNNLLSTGVNVSVYAEIAAMSKGFYQASVLPIIQRYGYRSLLP